MACSTFRPVESQDQEADGPIRAGSPSNVSDKSRRTSYLSQLLSGASGKKAVSPSDAPEATSTNSSFTIEKRKGSGSFKRRGSGGSVGSVGSGGSGGGGGGGGSGSSSQHATDVSIENLALQLTAVQGACDHNTDLTTKVEERLIGVESMLAKLMVKLDQHTAVASASDGSWPKESKSKLQELHESIESFDDMGQMLEENTNLDQMVERVRREQLVQHHKQKKAAPRRAHPLAELLGCSVAFDPRGKRRQWWDIVVTLLLVYCTAEMPLQVAFKEHMAPEWGYLNVAVDCLFLLDIAINFHTGFYIEGTLVKEWRQRALHYASGQGADGHGDSTNGGMLALDLIAAFPFALLDLCVTDLDRAWATTRIVRAVRLLRLLRGTPAGLKLPLITRVLEQYTRFNPGLLRVGRLLLLLLICCHWTGCLWYFIGAVAEDEVYNPWTPTAELRAADLGTKWLYAFYWAIGLLTGIAPTTVTPQTAAESGFSVIVLLGGVCLSALVVSSATSAVANLDAYAESHQTELDAINGYLRFKRVPHDLRRRINNFHNYIWSSMQYMDQNSAISNLPPQLRLQLLLALNLRCLAGVPIFKHCDTRVIIIVVQSMKSAVYCPNEFVVRQGTYGKALFLIARGTVHVIDKNRNDQLLATLSDNDFFGEMSLVSHDKTNASIRSLCYSDMNVLLRSDFLHIVELFPELGKVVSKMRANLMRERASKPDGAASPGRRASKTKLKAVRLAAAAVGQIDRKRTRFENTIKVRCSTMGSHGVLTNSAGVQAARRLTGLGGSARNSGGSARASGGAGSERRMTRRETTAGRRDTTALNRDLSARAAAEEEEGGVQPTHCRPSAGGADRRVSRCPGSLLNELAEHGDDGDDGPHAAGSEAGAASGRAPTTMDAAILEEAAEEQGGEKVE